MATIERRTEFCLWCGKKCSTPDGYDPRQHKFVCGKICAALETCFMGAFSDESLTAWSMYQKWLTQKGGK